MHVYMSHFLQPSRDWNSSEMLIFFLNFSFLTARSLLQAPWLGHIHYCFSTKTVYSTCFKTITEVQQSVFFKNTYIKYSFIHNGIMYR